MIATRIVGVVLFCPLALATSASAECAWVLWSNYDPDQWSAETATHALTQEVAYESLAPGRRQALHEAARAPLFTD